MIRVYKSRWPEEFFYDWINEKNIENHFKYDLLEKYFHYYNDKCVFCESSSSQSELMIGYYRPIEGALNIINGNFSKEHYRWLDNDWSNTLVICVECNRAKSNRFPIDGDFCSLEANEFELFKEKRLLINPFRDYPEKHFLYDKNGIIIPRTKKGELTVDVLNLNRDTLIEGRREELIHFKRNCQDFMNNSEDEALLKEIIKQIKKEATFAGIKRFFLSEMITENLIPYLHDFTQYLSSLIGRSPVTKRVSQNKVVKEKYLNKAKDNDYYNVTDEKDIQKYFLKQRFLEQVEIKNFKGLKYLKLDLTLSQSKDAPWLILLGENGIGKSSVLQAISIGLMGEQKRNEVISKEANKFVNNQQNEGFIKLKLTAMAEPIIVKFSKDGHLFKGKNHIDPRVLILSYGSTRLLPTHDKKDIFKPSWARVENLFDPFVPLVDVENYLKWLQQDEFIIIKSAIENLFMEKVNITRTDDTNEIKFRFANSIVSIEDLSDGYKTIIALATDIMMVMKNRWRSYDAEGIVLIDELDAHLHPRWNIEIVSRLRKAFPKIQFIATSHNPLTLRGLLKNEVAVMVSDNDRETFVLQSLPAQKGMMIEEILTSKFFGLYDTLPDLNLIFQEYYKLLANPAPSAEQEERIDDLKQKLYEYEKLGNTRRDKLFYDAIDKYIAKERKEDSELVKAKDSFSQDIDNIINSLKGVYKE